MDELFLPEIMEIVRILHLTLSLFAKTSTYACVYLCLMSLNFLSVSLPLPALYTSANICQHFHICLSTLHTLTMPLSLPLHPHDPASSYLFLCLVTFYLCLLSVKSLCLSLCLSPYCILLLCQGLPRLSSFD